MGLSSGEARGLHNSEEKATLQNSAKRAPKSCEEAQPLQEALQKSSPSDASKAHLPLLTKLCGLASMIPSPSPPTCGTSKACILESSVEIPTAFVRYRVALIQRGREPCSIWPRMVPCSTG
ncbi:hypothetical protein GOP47_0016943 [Adiantum capillus-veneris]|uniref:Uncharacterized protein n=1 Tax=Adiantum capillus-veneris TaxID=13818 RepID=A0A9D4UJJ7_ADICA|nr:hypothetical protein GOP47_0016943 [Adiantum capillus-veneris]